MPQAPASGMQLLHLYADDNCDTHSRTTDVALPLTYFAPPATPFNASNGQPATQECHN